MRVCGYCGSKQGPFEVLSFGIRTNRQNVYTCRSNWASKDNLEQRKPVIACLDRKAKQDEVRR